MPDLDSSYNFPPDSAMSTIVECTLGREGVQGLRLVPVWIERDAVPRIVPPEDPRFDRILAYLREITAEAGLGTTYTPEGDGFHPYLDA